MRAISLTQPWATAVAIGLKHYETRSWSTRYCGPLAIHAAEGFPPFAKDFASVEFTLGRLPGRIPFGAIVAICDLTACLPTWRARPEIGPIERIYGDYAEERFAFRLENVRALSEPLPCRGARGIWQVDPALAATARLLARAAPKERPAEAPGRLSRGSPAGHS